MRTDNDAAIEVLDTLGGDQPGSDSDNANHLGVLLSAMNTFMERNAARDSVWAEFGAADALGHIKSKAARLRKLEEKIQRSDPGTVEVTDDDIDDAIDLINYCVFFILHVRAGRVL